MDVAAVEAVVLPAAVAAGSATVVAVLVATADAPFAVAAAAVAAIAVMIASAAGGCLVPDGSGPDGHWACTLTYSYNWIEYAV